MQTVPLREAGTEPAGEAAATEQRVAARRARFREAVVKLAERGQSVELVRLLLLPGAFALLAGFGFMLLGWWGASRTHREIEQIPYLISGGLIGLGLVLVGALLLASAMWMTMLQRYQQQLAEQHRADLEALEARLAGERPVGSRPLRAARRADGAAEGNGARARR